MSQTSSGAATGLQGLLPGNKPGVESVTVDLTGSQDAPTPSQAEPAAVSSTSDSPQSNSVLVNAAHGISQTPLRGLEGAARQDSQQTLSEPGNAPYGQYVQQRQSVLGPQKPLAPTPAQLQQYNEQQGRSAAQPMQPHPQSHPQSHAQPQPTVFYPQQPGAPLLMNQCPRCGLRAGEPYQPVYHPTGHYVPHIPPEVPRAPPPQMPPTQSNYGPPPAGHPNAHMWVPPPGYQPPHPMPASVPVFPAQPAPPAPRHPNTQPVLPRWSTAPRLPSPPPAPRPLTLVDSLPDPAIYPEKYPQNGKVRKTNKPYRRRMSRDERRDILLMRKLGYKMEQIARYLGTTVSAVNYTIRQGDPEPKHKNAGRKVNIPEDRLEAMVAFAQDYLAREKACPVDKRTGRRAMKHLSYNMIRQAVLADENGEIPAKLKFTDEALKSALNKKGVWLRAPMSQTFIELARARGKKQWNDKVEKEKLAAQAVALGNMGNEGEHAGDGYVDSSELIGDNSEYEDEDMEDPYEGAGAISIPSDDENDVMGSDGEDSQDHPSHAH